MDAQNSLKISLHTARGSVGLLYKICENSADKEQLLHSCNFNQKDHDYLEASRGKNSVEIKMSE